MPIRHRIANRAVAAFAGLFAILLVTSLSIETGNAQQASRSTWDAADFRIWGYVPYWTSQPGTSVVEQLNILSNAGMYDHVSDVLYFGGVRPTPTGNLWYHSSAVPTLNTLESHSSEHGFDLHMSMFDVAPGSSVDATWTSLVSNQSYRANFVANVTNLLNTYGMKGFNFDWERPNTVEKWGNYTQLARELGEEIRPLGKEISIADYGGTDYRWDDSPLFDAGVYDQLFIMGYHYPAHHPNPNQWNNNNSFADSKLALTGQGADKAFTDEQLVLGIGTWGRDGPASVPLRTFAEANPNLGHDVGTVSGTYTALNGNTYSSTWTIESRQQVREKTQLALDRGMAGMMSWTLHYDAIDDLSLHRVMHHYVVFQRGIPDLNLDGRVDAADAHILADNIGTVPGWTGTNTPARFDNYYRSGNWEVGDHNGNGFVNQADADWLAGRFAALGIDLPDRLPYTGTFENFHDSHGLDGRWRVVRDSLDNLPETGNFAQHGGGFLAFGGSGVGADKHSTAAVTLRNQNAAERFDSINTAPREMRADLEAPIDLGQHGATYFTFLVRQNSAPLLSNHLTSPNRTLAFEFLDEDGANQLEFSFHGLQQQFAIGSPADPGGQDVSAGGFGEDDTYLFVGKIAGNGSGPSTLHASLFSDGSLVGNFTDPGFEWELTSQSSLGFEPVITQLQFRSLYEANYTVSNVWIGPAGDFFEQPLLAMGDYNGDGVVDAADYAVWRDSLGQIGPGLPADGHGNGVVDAGDYALWKLGFGATSAAGGQIVAAVPEPAMWPTLLLLGAGLVARTRKNHRNT